MSLFEGVPCPPPGPKPGDVGFLPVRKSTEGEYAALGGVTSSRTTRGLGGTASTGELESALAAFA